jgi:hypothetical protein
MKKILITFAATTALWAGVVFGAMKTEQVYVLSAANMRSLEEQFTDVYNAGYAVYKQLQKCQSI